MDFYEVDPDVLVTVRVRVRPVGTAIGIKLGGKLQIIRRTMDVRCKPADIPDFVDLDVTELSVNDMLRASQVAAPTNCELIFPADFNVVTVVGKKGAATAATAAEA